MRLEIKDASIGYKKQVLASNINMTIEPEWLQRFSDKMAAARQHL